MSATKRAEVRRLVPLLLALLTLLALPGASEALENLAHLGAEGHAAHARAGTDDAHGPMHLEHGCGGGTHVCVCHSPSFATLVSPGLVIPGYSATWILSLDAPERAAPRGVRRAVFRPPTV